MQDKINLMPELRATEKISKPNPAEEEEAEGCPVCRRGEMVYGGVIRLRCASDGTPFRTIRTLCDFCNWASSEEVEG